MAARSSKGRSGGRSSGSTARGRTSSRSGQSRSRGGSQSRSRRTQGARSSAAASRAEGGESESDGKRRPASRGAQSRAKSKSQSSRSRSSSSSARGRKSQASRRSSRPSGGRARSRSARSSEPTRQASSSRSRSSGGTPTRGRTSRAPRAARRSQADPIAILSQDHRNVAQLFEQFEKAQDAKKKRSIFEKIHSELELHAQLEEEIFYPEAESRPELKSQLKEAHGEHDKVKQQLREAQGLDPDSGEFDATVAGIQGAVEHHVQEEEEEIFPVIQQSFSEDHMKELAQRMQERRRELQRGNAVGGRGRSLVGRLMGR